MILFPVLFTIWVGVFGAAWAIADSKITLPIRIWLVGRLGEKSLLLQLLECPSCLSFWIGLATGLILTSGSPLFSLAVAFTCVGFSTIAWAFVGRNS